MFFPWNSSHVHATTCFSFLYQNAYINLRDLARASSFTRFLDGTQRRTTFGRNPLDEWSARHRDLYLTTHYAHNRKTFTPPVGFEPTILIGERPQTYALDHAATWKGQRLRSAVQYYIFALYFLSYMCWKVCYKVCCLYVYSVQWQDYCNW